MTEKKDDKLSDILNLNIFGIDIGKMVKNLGIDDVSALQDPEKIEKLKSKIEDQKDALKETQEQLKEKLGDKIKIDYNIKVSGLLDGDDGFKISNGKFFDNLDKFSKRSSQYTRKREKIYPGKQNQVIEPLCEVVDEKSHIEVIGELPGVTKEQIKTKYEKGVLRISAEGDKRKYDGKVKIPVKVLQKPVEETFNNGILKIKFRKSKTKDTTK